MPYPAIVAQATHYSAGDSNPRLADGTYYGAKGYMFCAAPRHIPMGAILKVRDVDKRTKSRRVIFVKVRDRGAFGRRNIDLSSRSFRRLVGARDMKYGRIKVRWTVYRLPVRDRVPAKRRR